METGKKIWELPEFAPILPVVTSPIQAAVVAYFRENPGEGIDAGELAGKLGDEHFHLVEEALADLKKAGILSSKVKGVAQTEHYHFTPDPAFQAALDWIFQEKNTRDYWREFRGYLSQMAGRRRKKIKLLLIAAAILLAVGMGIAVYFIVQSLAAAGREGVREDLSQFSGIHETRYPNDRVRSRIEYSEGRREGSFAAWFENGQKMAEGAYRHNRPSGRWVYWDEKGGELKAVTYQGGRALDR